MSIFSSSESLRKRRGQLNSKTACIGNKFGNSPMKQVFLLKKGDVK
tara:strand:+ start:9770 stop:9907 length:138 start_codon:yes stop_codon:yes gene_type:complete